MWTRPYGMKEGFLIGGDLILAGLMLELSAGPVDWDALCWPVNGIVLAVFLGIIVSFVLLQMCWWGINYLPAAQGSSVHVYTS